MCVMCTGNSADDRPTMVELKTAVTNNPDGFGYGIVYDEEGERKIHSFKSLDAEQTIMSYYSSLDFWGKKVVGHLFHARIATRGTVCAQNSHPFGVDDGSGSLLAHNGILPLGIPKEDTRVDSQVFAETILPSFGGVQGLQNQYTWDVVDALLKVPVPKSSS